MGLMVRGFAVILFCGFLSPLFSVEISADDLMQEVRAQRVRVVEFSAIEDLAKARGFRVFLFGGTAVTFANYVRLDFLFRHGDKELNADRFGYFWNQIYKSYQDLDLGIAREDGSPESAEQLRDFERSVRQILPMLKVDVYGFQTSYINDQGRTRENLINNFNLLNQNTDSLSNGLIELTSKSEILDLRTHSKTPFFIENLADEEIHYLDSPLHFQTERAAKGMNPLIFSVIRYFSKLGQFNLSMIEADKVVLHRIIEKFRKESAFFNPPDYWKNWLEANAKKIILGAEDLERQFAILDEFGIHHILGNVLNETASRNYMKRRPLMSFSIKASGRTAKSLGISLLTHETKSAEVYESIIANPRGAPNFLISDNQHSTIAAYGEGVYAKPGDAGEASGETLGGYHIGLELAPDAVEGVDFKYVRNHIIVLKNKAKVRVIYQLVTEDALKTFDILLRSTLKPFNQGYVETALRFASRKPLTADEENQLMGRAVAEMQKHSPQLVFALLTSKSIYHGVAEKIFFLLFNNFSEPDQKKLVSAFLRNQINEFKVDSEFISFIKRTAHFFDARALLFLGCVAVGAFPALIQMVDFPEPVKYFFRLSAPVFSITAISSVLMGRSFLLMRRRSIMRSRFLMISVMEGTAATRRNLITTWLSQAPKDYNFAAGFKPACRAILARLL